VKVDQIIPMPHPYGYCHVDSLLAQMYGTNILISQTGKKFRP